MTESIKQEIINNIFENGDKLITGPILQTVLIDMIDDVNVKDQAILSKTGSWDDAVTQIPNLATKAEVTNLSESVARDLENVVDVDLTGYATEQWVQNQGYLKEHQDISNLATKTELNTAKDNLQGNITSLSESVARDLANVSVPEGVATEAWVQSQDYASKSYVDSAVSSSSVDLTGYATETWVESKGYLTEHQDISNLATKSELNSVSESIQTDISNLATKSELTSVSESVQTDITNLSESVANSAVWKKGTGTDSIVQAIADGTDQPTASGERAIATGLRTVAGGNYSHAEGFLAEAPGLYSHAEGYGGFATGNGSHTEGYFAKASKVGSHAEGRFTNASGDYSHAEGTGSNASGEGSHAEGYFTTASGLYSHAEGYRTTASEDYSHTEGENTKASGYCSHAEGHGTRASGYSSHAEGDNTEASGQYSHTEGFYTVTSNAYEHAQGKNNHTSPNQVFSIGTGNNPNDRRNAISVLEVRNNNSLTSSFFVQNIGGYDGTNPTPGTNDLATVINNLPSGGGSSETLWKKGTGTDSIVQKVTDITTFTEPIASGIGAVAIGDRTKASGQASHAEGYWTEAKGNHSHAEGRENTAEGVHSHTEGFNTIASNDYEHAQGIRNHNSTNQIFSVGAGDYTGDYVEASNRRRNAISILAVPNAETQVVTASFFVQNIGGYDGTNPTPGTNDLATVINNLPSGGGSSETLWKKGEGQDSLVQVIADGTGLPTATGNRAIATGMSTTASEQFSHAEGSTTVASGYSSHAEGQDTNASGPDSHAEGDQTKASGMASHAEGVMTEASGDNSHAEGAGTKASGMASHAEGAGTIASNDYSHAEGSGTIASNANEHAQGMFNHSSENQIFSVGVGEGDPTDPATATRRNAISILAVPNETTWINTGSVFIQNVGGYDGTNPIPGTNDLATVINGMAIEGGIGTSSETWTFTLDDGSTVTKNIVMR